MKFDEKIDVSVTSDIQQIRVSLCNAFLVTMTVIVTPALFASLNRMTLIGWQPIMTFHIIAVSLMWVITLFRHKTPYSYKASFIVLFFFLVGIGGIIQFGLIAGGVAALVIAGPVATLFFEGKLGVAVLLLILLIESIIGFCIVIGIIRMDFDLLAYATAPSAWILGVFAVAISGGSLTVSTHIFNEKMIKTLREARQYQEDLQKHQLDLERTIDERTKELQKSNEDLAQFARIAAHDMRSPLNAINGYTQLLAYDYQGKLDKDANKYLDGITEGVRYTCAMIDDVLNYSEINSDHSDPCIADMNILLSKVKSSLSDEINQSTACITHNNLPVVHVVETQIIRVLQNILSNAIKYRAKERNLNIHIAAEKTLDNWKVSIADNGIGIENDQYEHIFKIFHIVDKQVNSESSGIGLAVCKRIIERHGGNIWVESELGKGSTFYFTLRDVEA